MSDYTAKNIAHFNKRAASYESPMKLELSRRICEEAFLKAPGVKWDPDSTVVVDFACGTGLISFNLLSHAKKVIGLDTSEGMLEVYKQKAAMDETANAKLSTLCVDILSMPQSDIPSEIRNVDIVVCALAYHHIDDINHVTKVLASLLKKGGHLLVFDLMESISRSNNANLDEVSRTFHDHKEEVGGESGHSHGHGHHHHHGGHSHGGNQGDNIPSNVKEAVPHIGGMAIEVLENAFNATGILKEVSAKPVLTFVKDGTEYTFALAQGMRD